MVPNRYIYVYTAGSEDPSRWLHLSLRRDGDCTLQLQDLCHPGKLSSLKSVACPLSYLQTALDRGPLQITTGTGYLLFRRVEETLHLEFRGFDDVLPTKVTLRMEDIRRRVENLAMEAGSLAAV